MYSIEQLRAKRSLINEIDWEMTPEKAVEMYLEWGSGWTRGNDFVASANDESYYFVIFDWEENPSLVTLIKRTVEGAEELAKIEVPHELFMEAWLEDGKRPGGTVHALNDRLKHYLSDLLSGPPVDFKQTH
ncbi:MAG: DVU0772 family protein [Thermodesulfobacteriota bacterium]